MYTKKSTLKVGDTVKAACYPGPVIGRITKIVGRCIFIDSLDNKGRALCVLSDACTLVPGLSTIEYARGVH